MYNTPYNQKIVAKIKNNNRNFVKNFDLINGQDSGMLHGGSVEQHKCHVCGGAISWDQFKHGMGQFADYIKPVSQPIIEALTRKGVASIEAAGIKPRRKRVTHKGDKDYHRSGHDIIEDTEPYEGAGFMDDLKGFAKYIAPVSKPIIEALTRKGVASIEAGGMSGGYGNCASEDLADGRPSPYIKSVAHMKAGKIKKAPTARNILVKKIMAEKHLSLPEASKFVKEHNLYKK